MADAQFYASEEEKEMAKIPKSNQSPNTSRSYKSKK
jgi:hypothetical protein